MLELLARRSFDARDFFETLEGVCRLTPGLARELAATCGHWGRCVGEVAEDVAEALTQDAPGWQRLPTPLTGRNGSAGRPDSGRQRSRTRSRLGPVAAGSCSVCGGTTTSNRRTCEAEAREAIDRSAFLSAGVTKLAVLLSQGEDPAHDAPARAKVGATQARRHREENEWDAAHAERPDLAIYRGQIRPILASVSISRIARDTGLSLAYCARIKRGGAIPHARWWEMLRRTAPGA